ncbi:hypothetical protein MAHJHV51_47440 [Mycobacterium avium subsp. hominissuis]
MWAQDVAAMFSYAAASESAGELTPFEQAPATTNDAGPATQAAAAAAWVAGPASLVVAGACSNGVSSPADSDAAA